MGLTSAFSSTSTSAVASSTSSAAAAAALNKTVAAAVPALSSALAKIMREGAGAPGSGAGRQTTLHKSATAPTLSSGYAPQNAGRTAGLNPCLKDAEVISETSRGNSSW